MTFFYYIKKCARNLSPALLDEFTDSVFTALQTVDKKARMMYQPQYSGYYPRLPMQPPMQQPMQQQYYYQQYAQYPHSDPHQPQTFTAMLYSSMRRQHTSLFTLHLHTNRHLQHQSVPGQVPDLPEASQQH
jgi:hypothetical protein